MGAFRVRGVSVWRRYRTGRRLTDTVHLPIGRYLSAREALVPRERRRDAFMLGPGQAPAPRRHLNRHFRRLPPGDPEAGAPIEQMA